MLQILFLSSTRLDPERTKDGDALSKRKIMDARIHSIESSLRTISVVELKALTDGLLPSADHPWLETFLNVLNDPASGAFYHANGR